MKQSILTMLALAFLPPPWTHASQEIELPDGRLVGGFVEDDGRAVLLLNRRARDWWRLERGGWNPEEGSFFVRLAPGGSIIDAIDLPNRSAQGLSTLDGGLLFLQSMDPADENGFSAIHREFLDLTADGQLRKVWGWNTRSRKDWLYTYFSASSDGRAWALHYQGEPPASRGSVVDRLYIKWGDLEPPDAEIDGEVVLRFGDSEEDGPWELAEELGYPYPIFLDSDGPVFSVVWKDRTYIIHMAEDGTVKHKIHVFGEEFKERSNRQPDVLEGRAGWQSHERVLWSRKDERLSAYHLPDLGLSGDVTRPFWVVDRKGEHGEIRIHRKRGVIGLRGQFAQHPAIPAVSGDADPGGRFRVDHIWRDPLAPHVEERRTTGWQSGRGGLPYWITVSPNAEFVLAVQQYTNNTRIIPMHPAPPIPEP